MVTFIKLYNQHAPRRVRVQSFGIRIMSEWNNLPRWVVEDEDLEKFKQNLDTYWHARQYLNTIPIMFPVMKITNQSAITGNTCRLYDIYTIGNMQNVLMTLNTISQ